MKIVAFNSPLGLIIDLSSEPGERFATGST